MFWIMMLLSCLVCSGSNVIPRNWVVFPWTGGGGDPADAGWVAGGVVGGVFG